MADVDPDTLLEWLQTGHEDIRDMQLIALEQLCTILLLSDNIDRCFETYPPRTFIPALCKIFLDESAPDNILEVTARALTYYLDVSQECTRRIVAVEGTVRAICNRLLVIEVDNKTSKDLAEQCIKTLELICSRESQAVFEAGGLNCILPFILDYGKIVYKDSLHSAMSVVTRLCGKMEPTDASLDSCVETLSQLLKHEDIFVADGALRCFASLSDRFTRKSIDPVTLAKHGLINELIKKLSDSTLHFQTNSNTLQTTSLVNQSNPNSQTTTSDNRSSISISTITGLLSTLCRNSASITNEILNSNILDVVEKALLGDERCVLDTIRFLDTLLLLIFEGRDALPKINSLNRTIVTKSTSKSDPAIEKLHRQLIDWIRNKDLESIIEALETNTFDINYTDDVGQTLLNWAAAFGSPEIVEYLCSKEADVNKGQRSSSLHYASCFGRSQIVKILLRYGANVDLRDEEGKTALDKARERNEEGHREVIQILQSPNDYIGINRDKTTPEKIIESNFKNETKIEVDNETAKLYIKRLLPILSNIYLNCMIQSISRSCLNLLKKLVNYAANEQLEKILQDDQKLVTLLVELIAKILKEKNNYETHYIGLNISNDLLKKCSNVILEDFTRLGVSDMIVEIAQYALNNPEKDDLDEETKSLAPKLIKNELEVAKNDDLLSELTEASVFEIGKVYIWSNAWCFVYTKDFLYVLSKYCAIELSHNSNGWFRFMINSQLYSMYSNGQPETSTNKDEIKNSFEEKLKKAKERIPSNSPDKQICFSIFKTNKIDTIKVENWSLKNINGEIHIKNTFASQTTILKNDLNGFQFESNRNEYLKYTADVPLSKEFNVTWLHKEKLVEKSPKQLSSKFSALQQYFANSAQKNAKLKQKLYRRNVNTLACQIYNEYLKENVQKPRDLAVKLTEIVNNLTSSIESNYTQSLKSLKEILLESDKGISSYELSTSGLVDILLIALTNPAFSNKFFDIFEFEKIPQFCSESTPKSPPLVIFLIRKLISLLETVENLPLFLYDAPGSYNLQAFSKRFKLILNKGDNEKKFLDFTGRVLKVEPLMNISHLEKYLQKVIMKEWYDFERKEFNYLNELNENITKNEEKFYEFNYTSNFDKNGLIWWIGTNGKTTEKWSNPGKHGLVELISSDGKVLPSGQIDDFLAYEQPLNCHTENDTHAWFALDLGVFIKPSHYTIRSSKSLSKASPRNWTFQMSKNGSEWIVLSTHVNDTHLDEPGSSFTWSLETNDDYRFVRFQQNGKNATDKTAHFAISGFEIYGKIKSVVFDKLEQDLICVDVSEELAKYKSQEYVVGSRVVRGDDWKWGAQDGGKASEGTILSEIKYGWVEVMWDSGSFNLYRIGSEGKYDLKIAPSNDKSKLEENKDAAFKKLASFSSEVIQKNQKIELNNKKSQFSDISLSKSEPFWSNLNLTGGASGSNKEMFKFTRLFSDSSNASVPLNRTVSTQPVNSNKTELFQSKLSILKNRKSNSTPILSAKPSSMVIAPKIDSQNESTSQSEASSINEVPSQTAFGASHFFRKCSHHRDQDNKSKSVNNLNTFNAAKMQETVSEPNALNESNQNFENTNPSLADPNLITQSSSSTYFPLETTMEECLDCLDTSFETDHMLAGDEKTLVRNIEEKAKITETTGSTQESDSNNNMGVQDEMFSLIQKLANVARLKKDTPLESNQDKQDTFKDSFMNLLNDSALLTIGLGDSWSVLLSELENSKLLESETKISNEANDDKKKELDRVSSIFQRCQSSIDQTLARVMDVQDMDDDDENMEDETDENIDEEYLDEDEYEKATNDSNSVNNDELSSNTGAKMFDLRRRASFKRTQLQTQQQQQQQQSQLKITKTQSNTKSGCQDEFVLKCQFSALIPAFDPRPGKTNVNQTQDIQVPVQTESQTQDSLNDSDLSKQLQQQQPKIDLYLKVNRTLQNSNTNDEPELSFYEEEIKLTNKNATIFQYIQYLISLGEFGQTQNTQRYEKMKKIWDESYTLIYRRSNENQNDEQNNELSVDVDKVLRLLSLIRQMIEYNAQNSTRQSVLNDEFFCKKINNKLIQQLQDPLVLASKSLPVWCKYLLHTYQFIFPYETRQLYFSTTAFGVSRTIVWLQNKRDQLLATLRGPNRTLRDDQITHEYQIGRLKHERVKIPRDTNENLLNSAFNLLKFHANRKAILEIEFTNEEGTGLGPTLEFYSLIAHEFQRKKFALWICEDDVTDTKDLNDVYVHYKSGLFPIAYSLDWQMKNKEKFDQILDMFKLLGIFVAKSLQDQRLIDVPLSEPFLKILCHYGDDNLSDILSIDDLCEIDEYRANLIKEFSTLANKRDEIQMDKSLSDNEKQSLLNNLKLKLNDNLINIDDLELTFEYNPPSKVYGYDSATLMSNGENEKVNLFNIEKYSELLIKFIFDDGIKNQLKAFKYGFDLVFPMDSLKSFESNELRVLISGDQAPKWTYEDIMNYTEPKLGYCKER